MPSDEEITANAKAEQEERIKEEKDEYVKSQFRSIINQWVDSGIDEQVDVVQDEAMLAAGFADEAHMVPPGSRAVGHSVRNLDCVGLFAELQRQYPLICERFEQVYQLSESQKQIVAVPKSSAEINKAVKQVLEELLDYSSRRSEYIERYLSGTEDEEHSARHLAEKERHKTALEKEEERHTAALEKENARHEEAIKKIKAQFPTHVVEQVELKLEKEALEKALTKK